MGFRIIKVRVCYTPCCNNDIKHKSKEVGYYKQLHSYYIYKVYWLKSEDAAVCGALIGWMSSSDCDC